ncbi:MAG: P27 family phage terminase small subunit [Steroidobacteraceae bacterium]
MKNSGAKPPKTRPKPPKGLSAESLDWWERIGTEYDVTDPGGLLILASACEAFDRMRQAQRKLRREGLTAPDRFGQRKAHPATLIERDSRAAMLSALKQLNLDLEPLESRAGRPNGR